MKSNFKTLRPSLVASTVASTLALCSTSAFAAQSLVKGVVGGAYFNPPVVADTAAASRRLQQRSPALIRPPRSAST